LKAVFKKYALIGNGKDVNRVKTRKLRFCTLNVEFKPKKAI
jgi:hypothetical protein